MQGVLKNIIHPIIRVLMKVAAAEYFEQVIVKGKENLPSQGPCIFACNHPNSFLDALVITTIYRQPLYYLARGDAFKKPLGSKLLHFLNNIPMYRKEEGTKNMSRNRDSFDYCINVLQEGDTVLVFSEGVCENEWHLRTFRKGTARLAYDALQDKKLKEKLKVIPVAINYSGWLGAGNKMYLEFMPALSIHDLPQDEGLFLNKFNEKLRQSLEQKCLSTDKDADIAVQNTVTGFILKNLHHGDAKAIGALAQFEQATAIAYQEKYRNLAAFLVNQKPRYYCEEKVSVFAFLISALVLPVAVFLNFIPYCICKFIAEKTTRRNVFYDSVFFGSLVLLGNGYLIILAVASIGILHSLVGLAIPILAVFCALYFENAKRNIYCFLTSRKQSLAKTMLSGIC